MKFKLATSIYFMFVSYIINQIRSSYFDYVPSAVLLSVFLIFFNLISLYPYRYTFTVLLVANLFLTFVVVCGLLRFGYNLFSQSVCSHFASFSRLFV